MRSAIHRFKYVGRESLSPAFAQLLAYAWSAYPELHGVDGIASVPMHAVALQQRGYNQADLLAQNLSRLLGLPYLYGLLRRTRPTTSQFRLRRQERQHNLVNAFAVHASLSVRRRSLLLIDDVSTTGATLSECVRVLRKAGAQSIQALVLAKDP